LIGETAYVHLGPVEQTDSLVIVADFLMKLAEVTWSVVSGVKGDKLIVIFRNAGFRRNAGKWAKDVFGPYGSAGGHKDAARAEVPVDAVPADRNGDKHYAQFVRLHLKKGR
jgi:nanoRNase/pAp phosphatase (c-di-AMP/oligoRNAs hydrolase)